MTQHAIQKSSTSVKADLKGSSFSLSVLQLGEDSIDDTLTFLQQKVSQAPAFFKDAPVVVNVEKTPQTSINFDKLYQGIRQVGMYPVGITGCNDKKITEKAANAGFAIMRQGKAVPCLAEEAQALNNKPEIQEVATLKPTKIIRTPVRSGQQIYAQGSDLVVLNHVSAGAEVIADGSIQILGSCRGRVIAGANGQTNATIICHDLRAELVSIAGNYWLSEQIEKEFWQQKVILTLNKNQLKFETLTI